MARQEINHNNNINTFNNIINYPTNINTRAFINNNNDFIPFINSSSRQDHIDVNIAQFTITDEDRQCCICMEERQSLEICRLNCMHSFCVECINQHLQTNQTCPICRTQVTSLSVQNNDAMDRINL